MGWREIAEDVMVLGGSPATGVIITNGIAFVIDPGYGNGRAKEIHGKLDSLEVQRRFALLTHGHVDHIAECRGFERVFAHRWCTGLAESATLRNVCEFGVNTTKGFTFITGDSVPVTDEIWWGDEILGIKALDSHGHTPGHTAFGYKNVVFAGDSVFGDKLLKKVKILYHTNVFEAEETLKRMRNWITGDTVLVPGHGPIVKGENAKALIDENIHRIEQMKKDLWDALDGGGTLEEITVRIMELYGLKIEPEFVLLDMVPIRSILSRWLEDGKVKVEAAGRGITWKKRQ